MIIGKGLMNQVSKSNIKPYERLTYEALHKHLTDINRHKTRDSIGRFTKKNRVVVLPNIVFKALDKIIEDNGY